MSVLVACMVFDLVGMVTWLLGIISCYLALFRTADAMLYLVVYGLFLHGYEDEDECRVLNVVRVVCLILLL